MNIGSFFRQLAPHTCVLCGADAPHPVCAGCWVDLPWHTAPACPVCAMPTPSGEVCGACLRHPPAFDRTTAAFDYRYPLDRLIPAYKYRGRLALSAAFVALLTEHLTHAPRPDALIAMPLHPRRLGERSFDPVGEIARPLARALALPLLSSGCIRTRDTPPQQGLPVSARRGNVRGAFACTAQVAGRHVAVLDDVMTSGATLDALARALKAAGAREVSAWVLARTLDSPR